MLTIQEVNQRLKNKNLKLMSEFKGVQKQVEVQCFCGKIFKTRLYHIFRGKCSSCGCVKILTHEEIEERLELKGLKLISIYTKRHDKHTIRCFCGEIFKTTLHHIFTDNTSSCGCLQYKQGKDSFRYSGFGDISGTYFKNLKCNAHRRELEFSITMEYIWNLFLIQNKKCAISGEQINLSPRYLNGINQSASLDRIDSSKGYIEGNVQWVHKIVNRIKWSLTTKEFLELNKIIYKFNNRENV